MYLKIKGKRIFEKGENAFDPKSWTAYEPGVYEALHYPRKSGERTDETDRILMFWGYDNNFPAQPMMPCCIPMPNAYDFIEEVEQPQKETAMSSKEAGISGDVLLKAIAIAQDPKLSLELLNRQ